MSKNNGTIARQAAAVGMSKREFLLDLKSRHTKISSMAVELGVTHVAVTCALSKLGISHQHPRHFEYCGVVDCLTNHCRRYGIEPGRVFRSRDKLGITAYQALDLAVLNHVWPC